ADPALDQKRRRLAEALTRLNAFEDTRDRRIETERRRYTLPLHVCWQTAGVLFRAYLSASGLSWLMRVRRRSWTLPHSRLGVDVFIGGQAALLLLLTLMAFLQQQPSVPGPLLSGLRVAWWAMIALLLLFGPIYPHLRLPAYAVAAAHCRENAQRQREEDEVFRVESGLPVAPSTSPPEPETSTRRAARGARRIAYVALMRRYYGIAFGLFLCTVSLWTIGYRVATSLYPWQLEVLVTGLGREEAELVHGVIAFLAGSGS
ncbi:MAG: hypothetical protein NTU83_08090, partial [Candidatus Hydrogenedentes bacterium]|nr:hypothetical protein [Candidatus Hydrogenedentota bacterium]